MVRNFPWVLVYNLFLLRFEEALRPFLLAAILLFLMVLVNLLRRFEAQKRAKPVPYRQVGKTPENPYAATQPIGASDTELNRIPLWFRFALFQGAVPVSVLGLKYRLFAKSAGFHSFYLLPTLGMKPPRHIFCPPVQVTAFSSRPLPWAASWMGKGRLWPLRIYPLALRRYSAIARIGAAKAALNTLFPHYLPDKGRIRTKSGR